ncbi:MAG: Gfo/Idh/MocA family oxidoreductase, partial [Rikenellaceae bacterium]
MKKLFLTMVAIALLMVGCQDAPQQTSHIIPTPTPERAAGQTDVLQLTTEKLPVVRVGFIGLGMRGPGAVERMLHIPGVEVVALCDIEKDRVQNVNKRLEAAGRPKAQEFYGDTTIWRELSKMEGIDLIYIATNWQTHAMMGVQAMKDGKHVAIEVPSAMTMDEI